jgi:hypothetical protein
MQESIKKHKCSHSLHDVLEYVRLNPELVAGRIKRSKVSKAMKVKQIQTYRMHMVLMLDYDALERFEAALRGSNAQRRSFRRRQTK